MAALDLHSFFRNCLMVSYFESFRLIPPQLTQGYNVGTITIHTSRITVHQTKLNTAKMTYLS